MASSSPESTPVITRIGTQATSTRLSREDWSHQCFCHQVGEFEQWCFAEEPGTRGVIRHRE